MNPKLGDRSFRLLADLARNNTKEWYHAHKGDIEGQLLAPFADILEAISVGLAGREIPFHGGRETMFRMNRDIRFSADKSPYKTNVSGLLTTSATKETCEGCVYLQLDAGGGFAAFGRYGLDAKSLGPIRDRIVAEPEQFGAILTQLRRGGFDLFREDRLKTMPRGYAGQADYAFAEELRLTNLLVRQELPKGVWTSGDVIVRVADAAAACRWLMEFVSV